MVAKFPAGDVLTKIKLFLFTLCLSPDRGGVFVWIPPPPQFLQDRRHQDLEHLQHLLWSDQLLQQLDDGVTFKSLIDPLLPSYRSPVGTLGCGERNARQQADRHAPAVAPPVTVPLQPGESGAGPQWEPARGAGAEDHSHRDNGDRGGVRRVELALHDLPGPLVLLQLLHPVPQQVHPVTSGGGAQHVG